MQLTSEITVNLDIEQVWDFLSDPLNSPKWDKSVASVVLPEGSFSGTGCIVDTIAPSGMRQSFRVTEFQPPRFFKFILLQSSTFKEADMSFLLEKVSEGTKITHVINFKLHLRSFMLYPVLLLTSKKALGADMTYLKNALELE
ncbi:MAG: SRPBCC family protein [Chitinophagaceae bacterium]|nr:SRPBCC family protein [Chitinophagaceae bacterium]MCB9045444.1 SRPBCC family protein [Chitinophagales bacterium]